jgi:hypothetical protein
MQTPSDGTMHSIQKGTAKQLKSHFALHHLQPKAAATIQWFSMCINPADTGVRLPFNLEAPQT